MTDPPPPWATALDQAWREERVAVLATVARRLGGDLQAAEDAVQESFAAAARTWPTGGVPGKPGAWLTTTAWRKALDVIRRDRLDAAPDARHEPAVTDKGHVGSDEPDHVIDLDPVARQDDVLSLVLTCCHPALAPEAQVALTLRHVVGLSTRQIASRLLVAEPALTKRLVRARAKIRDAGIRFDLPDRTRLAERIDEVHTVVYLVFTEGYLASGPEQAIRSELCEEAIWLARQLHRIVPEDETTGLLALLLIQHSRSAAREDAGHLVPLLQQDRDRWDARLLAEARALLSSALTSGAPGPYRLQAAIALLHGSAPPNTDPPWRAIADLYAVLARVAPSPVVEVHRAVAVGRAEGPRAGLAILAPVLRDPRFTTYLPALAAHADLRERLGDPDAARAWQRAAAAAENPQQRAHLLRRAGGRETAVS